MTHSNSPAPQCAHQRTQLIAKDNDAQYVECLDCGELFEVGELPTDNAAPNEKPTTDTPGETLSDA